MCLEDSTIASEAGRSPGEDFPIPDLYRPAIFPDQPLSASIE
jgi:hypothetical protein